MEKEVKLYMIFDILGDTVRTGPLLWQVKRKRIEDVKNHVMDLLFMYRVLKKKFPIKLNDDKVFDYIVLHDLPESITGDITNFEGVSKEEKNNVTDIAIEYLDEKFNSLLDIKEILLNYESVIDIESKVVHMLDSVHSAIAFIKYESENHIDYDDINILPVLRNHSYVVESIEKGNDVADTFYFFHKQKLIITEIERKKFGLKKETAMEIEDVIISFIDEMYKQKLNKTLIPNIKDFPKKAVRYNKSTKNN